ncbi:hypothetical protein U4E84_14250 [Halorubrum sp. AD140]|uniref:hypothetical protein n=1 Tax=Halorubrum sp. AD140 TaxID=3050073 RepID=UPI002ACCD57F|nr:hypothetical protein [Halorubrum sp. AD140]MDZ5812508.1 hypothetical protein [Halorubrum sp. AD140]
MVIAGRAAERRRTVVTAFAVVVFVGSVVPVPSASSGGGTGGVLGGVAGALPPAIGLTTPFHFLGYAGLAALLVRAAESASGGNRERRVVVLALAAAAATAFGFGIELVQAPIPWRSFAWGDAAVNAAGAVVGAGGYAMTTRLYALARSLR